MTFKIHILGCGSALPTSQHYASSQVVQVHNRYYIIDCGEGCQIQLRRQHIPFNKIQAIFITHLHGDHCFGLMGVITTFSLLGRTTPLHIYAPKELEGILMQQIDMFCSSLGYTIEFHAVDTTANKVFYEDDVVSITSVPLRHRVPCCGYLFREKSATPHSYAYCSDTRYIPTLYEMVRGVECLYHESTYMSAQIDKAEQYFHSTAAQAAQVARDAGVEKLLLGHYSARYNDENLLLEEARAIFPNAQLSQEGMIIEL